MGRNATESFSEAPQLRTSVGADVMDTGSISTIGRETVPPPVNCVATRRSTASVARIAIGVLPAMTFCHHDALLVPAARTNTGDVAGKFAATLPSSLLVKEGS